MGNFPVPTSGTVWASGGISGRVGVKQMRKRSFKRRGGRKPWESMNWIPYMGYANQDPFYERDDGAGSHLVLTNAAAALRVVNFAPFLMDKSTFVPVSAGTAGTANATDGSLKLRRIQGELRFDGLFYIDGDLAGDAQSRQQGQWQRIWYSWQKEAITPNGFTENIADLGYGPGVLSGARQLTSKRFLSHGIVDWYAPAANNSSGVFTGESRPRRFTIPLPKLGPMGLKLGVGDALTCIVRGSYGLGYGRDLGADFTNSANLPWFQIFSPQLRFLCAE